jgi:hypothetical protein
MVNEISSYSLEFEGFSIEFDVRLQRSISETRAFRHGKPTDFAYVVADIWLKSGNSGAS